MRMKYGGPQSGRPGKRSPLKPAKVVKGVGSEGRHYLGYHSEAGALPNVGSPTLSEEAGIAATAQAARRRRRRRNG